MGSTCSQADPTSCDCWNDGQIPLYQDTYQWCTFDKAQCCFPIGNKFADYGHDYKVYNCKIVNQTMVQLNPDLCEIPCSSSYPENCEYDCITDGKVSSLKEIYPWCTSERPECCQIIGKNYNQLGFSYTEKSCKIVNQTMVQLNPDICQVPCSSTYPENCEYDCITDGKVPSLKDTHLWCTSEQPQCCETIGKNYTQMGYNYTEKGCQILNETMVQMFPQQCKILGVPSLNWRLPITNGTKCFTSIPGDQVDGMAYFNQSVSLGNGFICMNYISWFEPLKKYVNVATTGDLELYSALSLYPNIYMNLTQCSTDYCNDPKNLKDALKNFRPEISGRSGPGLDCYKGVYPDVFSTFVYNAESCIRYSFKSNFNSSSVTVYDGLPSSLIPKLQTTLYIQNVSTCSTPNCNSIIIPEDLNNAGAILEPNQSGNLTCFDSVDSAGVVVAHPNPIGDSFTKYCVRIKSTLDNTKMFFSVNSYNSFSSYSKATDFYVCNTSLCNTASSSAGNLKCYLTNSKEKTNHIQFPQSLPVDYCVKYITSSGVRMYSAVTTEQLFIITSNPSKFTEVESCQSDYCLVP